MIQVIKKDNEKPDRLLRRFNRSIQLSGILSVARKKRFFEKEPNKSKIRKDAMRKKVIQELKRKKREGYFSRYGGEFFP